MKAGDRKTFTLMPDGVVVFRVKNKSVMTLADRLHKKGRKAVPVEQLSRLPLWRPLGQQSLELLQHVRHAHGDDAGTRSATHCLPQSGPALAHRFDTGLTIRLDSEKMARSHQRGKLPKLRFHRRACQLPRFLLAKELPAPEIGARFLGRNRVHGLLYSPHGRATAHHARAKCGRRAVPTLAARTSRAATVAAVGAPRAPVDG